MKTPALGFLLFLCSIAITQAQQSQPQASSNTGDQATLREQRGSAQNSRTNGDDFYSEAKAESFCAVISTYHVRREGRGSDAVTPAGYTTCLPSTRFEFRSAVQTEPPPRR